MQQPSHPISPGDTTGIVPEGVEPPADIPPEIFDAALRTYRGERRLDMRALAAELGIGRSSLYRKVQSRDHLLSAVLWFLARRAIVKALEATLDLSGPDRVLAVISIFLHGLHDQPELRRLLHEEPEAALRVLTSKQGDVQRNMIAAVERLLAAEETVAARQLTLDRGTLAYVMVRIGESFLYADVIADNESDVDRAVEVVAQLLGAEHLPAAARSRAAQGRSRGR